MRLFLVFSWSLLAIAGILTGCQTINRAFSKSNANARAGIIRVTKYVESDTAKKRRPADSQGTLYWSHFDATKRSSIINANSNGTTTILAEVTPDAAVQKTLEVLSKAKVLDKVDAEAQLKTASTIAQLGQRTANVNMLREALYRIAEGANNEPNVFYFRSSSTVAGKPGATKKDSTKPGETKLAVSEEGGLTTSTMYERLFLATLKTYEVAVKAQINRTMWRMGRGRRVGVLKRAHPMPVACVCS